MSKIENLALARANEIIEAWWHADIGEFQEEHDLSDEEMDQVLSVGLNIKTATSSN